VSKHCSFPGCDCPHHGATIECQGPQRKGDWMSLASGRIYYPLDPRPEDVFIEDIAHSLSMQCRYGGHSRVFYSVAEHSYHLSFLVPEEHALVALLHDATEAYVSDVPRPLKPYLSNYAEIEDLNWAAIAKAFDLPAQLPACVKEADLRICVNEMATLFPEPPIPYGLPEPYPQLAIVPDEPSIAKMVFLNRFHTLWNKRMAERYPAAERRAA
jgi:hypothetical protein